MGFFQKFQKNTHPSCTAVIVAAGTASRMNGIDKIMTKMGDKPVIAHTLLAFDRCDCIDEIIVVTRSDLIMPVGELCKSYGVSKVKRIVEGGQTRTESVLKGLNHAAESSKLVAIHDGARPFVSNAILQATIDTAARSAAAAPAIAVTDTIKEAENGIICVTPDRSRLFAVQTPQVFDVDLIRGALFHCMTKGIPLTDDCSAVEQLGKQVVLTEGSPHNIKITTQFDLLIGEAILSCQDAT